MNVMEIYRSVQGEGTLMGVPTTFVRFFACNLRCSWCDTKYSWSVREGGTWESISAQEIAERVHVLGAQHVVLTGGEPTLQKDLAQLAQLLKDQGHHLTVETNTTIFPAAAAPLMISGVYRRSSPAQASITSAIQLLNDFSQHCDQISSNGSS